MEREKVAWKNGTDIGERRGKESGREREGGQQGEGVGGGGVGGGQGNATQWTSLT